MSRPTRFIKPRANCVLCQGRGTLLSADSFDRDNGKPCPVCEARAKKVGAKVIPRYPR